jgi:hypothetical protein
MLRRTFATVKAICASCLATGFLACWSWIPVTLPKLPSQVFLAFVLGMGSCLVVGSVPHHKNTKAKLWLNSGRNWSKLVKQRL